MPAGWCMQGFAEIANLISATGGCFMQCPGYVFALGVGIFIRRAAHLTGRKVSAERVRSSASWRDFAFREDQKSMTTKGTMYYEGRARLTWPSDRCLSSGYFPPVPK